MFLYILAGFLLLIILIVFLPFHYKVEGEIGGQTKLTAKVSWFFKLLRVHYFYISAENELETDLTVKIGFYNLPMKDSEPDKKPLKEKKPVFSKQTLTNLDIKPMILLGIEFMKKLWGKLRPKHFRIRGVVGLNDPCATGQFIGAYEAAAGALNLRKNVDLQGDFSQSKLEMELKLAGRFAIASILGPCIWLVFQKPFREGLKGLKRSKQRG